MPFLIKSIFLTKIKTILKVETTIPPVYQNQNAFATLPITDPLDNCWH